MIQGSVSGGPAYPGLIEGTARFGPEFPSLSHYVRCSSSVAKPWKSGFQCLPLRPGERQCGSDSGAFAKLGLESALRRAVTT